jgi:glycine/D-amino acid oxidase-like deaminating enzyme
MSNSPPSIRTCDIVIIGGAVMGSSAAFWLSKQAGETCKIIVIEPDPGYSKSSTALSVASIRQQFTTRINVEISRFGIDFIRNFHNYTGQGRPLAADPNPLGFCENGYLFLAGNSGAVSVLQEACDMQNSLGAKTALLDKAALKRKFPWINVDDIEVGSYGATDEGWFDNMGLLNGLKSAARCQGVTYIKDRVTGLNGTAGKVQSVALASGGVISAGTVINAAGTFAAKILAGLDEELPVEPRKRTVFLIDAPNAIHPEAPLTVCHTGFYLRPENRHWLCATVPEVDQAADPDDFTPDLFEFEQVIWEKLYHRSPGFDAVRVLSAWAGHYAYNRFDQNAIVGRHPNWSNLYLMNGFSGHGLQQAPAIGRAISELVLHGRFRTSDMQVLAVERIYDDRPFREKAVV